MMCAMEWAKLGERLKAAREAIPLTQEELGERIGVGRNALRLVENGRAKRVTATIRAYAREVGWTDDSVTAVLAGREPRMRGDFDVDERGTPGPVNVHAELARALLDRLPQRILQELADGHVVDSDVMDLTGDGSSAVMTLVVERGADPAPDEVRDHLREWGKVQREIRRIMLDRT